MPEAEHSSTSTSIKLLIEHLIDQGSYVEALTHARALLTSSPPDAEIYALLGHIEINLGRLSIARRYLLEALRLAPQPETAKENIASLDDLEIQVTDGEYIDRWLDWRTRHLDFPRMIYLETTGRCNAKCDFCPHPKLDRKFDAMSDELFEKIVLEASEFPAGQFAGFSLHAVNEPFMDRKIFDRLSAINQRVPHAQIAINTNMNVMPPRFFERIRGIREISDWSISFNAANRPEYEESMQIDFARTVLNIRRVFTENRATPFVKGPIGLSRVCTGDDRDKQFVDQCKTLFDDFVCGVDFEPRLLGKANWLGDVSGSPNRYLHSYPCYQWVNFVIHCNGIVPHCCVDARGQFPFGDVSKQSIQAIYNNPYWRILREKTSCRDAVYPCSTCNLA